LTRCCFFFSQGESLLLPLNMMIQMTDLQEMNRLSKDASYMVCTVSSRSDVLSTFLLYNFNMQILRMMNAGIQPIRLITTKQAPGIQWIGPEHNTPAYMSKPKQTENIHNWIESHIDETKEDTHIHVFDLDQQKTQEIFLNDDDNEESTDVWVFLPLSNTYVSLWHQLNRHTNNTGHRIVLVPMIERNAHIMRDMNVLQAHGNPVFDHLRTDVETPAAAVRGSALSSAKDSVEQLILGRL